MGNFLRICVCLSLGMLATGCAKPEEPLHPVAGRVMLDGKPLPKGDVVFVPDADKGNAHLQFGIGKIGPDGSYVAQTFEKGGVKAGWFKVAVIASQNEPEANPAWVPIWIVPEKYTSSERTPLSVEVVPNPPPGAYDLVLER